MSAGPSKKANLSWTEIVEHRMLEGAMLLTKGIMDPKFISDWYNGEIRFVLGISEVIQRETTNLLAVPQGWPHLSGR